MIVLCLYLTIFFVFSARASYVCRSSTSGELVRKPPVTEDSERSYEDRPYIDTYPISPSSVVNGKIIFKIAVISDNDEATRSAKDEYTWLSNFKMGTLWWEPESWNVSFAWWKDVVLKSRFSFGGRGMELSELFTFDGKLMTVDDRTGIVFHIKNGKAYPWILIPACNGTATKGFKAEWATVKDEHLYVGSNGIEKVDKETKRIDRCAMYVKRISQDGVVEHIDWQILYLALRDHFGIAHPGYLTHESCVWSGVHHRWYFFPRRLSDEKYDPVKDEFKGNNKFLSCDENFGDIQSLTIEDLVATEGVSSFKFIPGTLDYFIVALTTIELLNEVSSSIMVFTITGKVLIPPTSIGDSKFEGFEFI